MKIQIAILVALLSFGCSSNRLPGEHFEEPHERKADDAPIDVYSTQLPSRPYREIGEYTANPKKLIIWARRMGADGVIFVDGAETRTKIIGVGNTIVAKSRKHGQKGVAIIYTDNVNVKQDSIPN